MVCDATLAGIRLVRSSVLAAGSGTPRPGSIHGARALLNR
jgi:hypothetical protein